MQNIDSVGQLPDDGVQVSVIPWRQFWVFREQEHKIAGVLRVDIAAHTKA
jgi:hypothetical protein